MINFQLLTKNHFIRYHWLSLGLFAMLLGYTLFSVFADNIAKRFIDFLLLGAFFTFFIVPKSIRTNGSFYIFFATLAAALASWALMLYQHPDIAETSPQVHKLTYWMFLLPLAFAYGGDERKVIACWLLAAVSLLLAPWFLGVGYEAIKQGLAGSRTDLNLLNAQHGAMYFAVLLLGLGALLSRLLRLTRWRIAALIGWLLVTCYVSTAIVVTQTRAVWLGVFLALCAQATVKLFLAKRSWKQVVLVVLLTFVPLIGLVAFNGEMIEDRLLQSQVALESITQGEKVPFDSAGTRINLWQEALPWIYERPLTGWGVSGKKLVIQQAEGFPDWVKNELSHMHNSFLDALVNFGILGLAAVFALWAFMARAAWRLWREGEIADDMFIFYSSFLVLWFIINCFESYMQFASGHFVFALLSGGILSLAWRSEMNRSKPV